ncbi:rhodopsin [Salinadaptatus halalkaliphilus]|uniref:Rhodopsin n=1 Tax=Salinadaptatus halalkaliphilus TaxID=2419781 RepID=A0A4S3TN85_9EURY|nr:bacteriorhodopsin [Salinadaptatus halalkaliphilus]THE65764.1 rhodopsin [Salinadaptatus halalkaliphilus]
MVDVIHALSGSAIAFGVATAVFFVWARSFSKSTRRYGYIATLAGGAMAVTYVLIVAVDIQYGADTDLIRFLGYTFMWLPILYLLCAVAGVGRQLALALTAIVLGRVWITLVSWYLDGILSTIATLLPFVLLAAGIYLLFGPFSRIAGTRSRERALLFDKLKYLVVLGWLGLVGSGLISADALGLTDEFVGQISVMYVELILVVGFVGIVLRRAEALEDIAESGGFLASESVETLERTDYAESETAD